MPTNPAHAEAIEASLEIAADRAGDLTPAVYERLFAQQPEMKPLFWRDTNHQVKGEMLARALEALLDFIGPRLYAHRLIQCEVVTHDGYAVPPLVFSTFFTIVSETVEEVCAEAWTPAMATAWRAVVADIQFYVSYPDQLHPDQEAQLRAALSA